MNLSYWRLKLGKDVKADVSKKILLVLENWRMTKRPVA